MFKSKVIAKYNVTLASDMVRVYHVTYASRLPSIAQHGLRPNQSRSIGAPCHDSHAKGRVFVSEFDGVSFWHQRSEEFAEAESDHPLTDLLVPVVLSFEVEASSLTEDTRGTSDSTNKAWFLTDTVKPDKMDVFHNTWVPIREHKGFDYSEAFTIEDDPDGGTELQWFNSDSPFMPTSED